MRCLVKVTLMRCLVKVMLMGVGHDADRSDLWWWGGCLIAVECKCENYGDRYR